MGYATIVGLDLGKFKSVCCVMDAATGTHTFETLASAHAVRDRGGKRLGPKARHGGIGRPGDRRVAVDGEEQRGPRPGGRRQASVVAGLCGRAGHLGEQVR